MKVQANQLKKGMKLQSGAKVIESAFCPVSLSRKKVQVGLEWPDGITKYYIWNAKTSISIIKQNA